jgi:hypothetical protein
MIRRCFGTRRRRHRPGERLFAWTVGAVEAVSLAALTVAVALSSSPANAWSVEAPGIENELGRSECTISRRGGTIRHEGGLGSVPSRASKCANGGGVGTESSRATRDDHDLRGVVEPALARALVLAAEAHRWELVAQIATELAAQCEGSGRCRATSSDTEIVKQGRGSRRAVRLAEYGLTMSLAWLSPVSE